MTQMPLPLSDLHHTSSPASSKRYSLSEIPLFQQDIKEFYKKYARMQPWRHSTNTYHVFVSEIMLQQTQIPRVLEKFPQFIDRFPTFQTLAASTLEEVIAAWQGLGYNRRARFLREIAIKICNEHDGVLPRDPSILITFPGIGPATAGSLCAFAYNEPVVFIETNIRRVFIHSFFDPKKAKVHDNELYPLVKASLDYDNPREWYYALMDYGTMLAKQGGNANRNSVHYTRQSAFEGSDRQIRGTILRVLVQKGRMREDEIKKHITASNQSSCEYERLQQILHGLIRDHMIVAEDGGVYTIAS
ncbi:MAG: A/G-specific adenine glycosylase [Methanomicrobiales archaeon]|jgi:A/G-specific adenine glycosylase|nr:A/G-specific adenine glycosylase [Methanomicrobiales archaeon]